MCLGYFVLVSVCAKIHPFIPESLIYFSTQTSQLRIGGDYDWPLSILQDYHGPDQAAQLSFMNHFGIFLEHVVHQQVFSVLPRFVVKYQLDTAIILLQLLITTGPHADSFVGVLHLVLHGTKP